MHHSLPDSDTVLAQFNRLIQDLLRGNMQRNTFRPWEIDILLDIESCNLRDSSRRETLRRYQRAVQRQMEKGGRLPLKLTEYLDAVKAKRTELEAKQNRNASKPAAEPSKRGRHSLRSTKSAQPAA
jgi:hypothetical protein